MTFVIIAVMPLINKLAMTWYDNLFCLGSGYYGQQAITLNSDCQT